MAGWLRQMVLLRNQNPWVLVLKNMAGQVVLLSVIRDLGRMEVLHKAVEVPARNPHSKVLVGVHQPERVNNHFEQGRPFAES